MRRSLPPVAAPLAALALLVAAGCAGLPPLQPRTPESPEVRTLDVGTGTHAYVVMGARPILVDTGWGGRTDVVEEALAKAGVRPRDLALIVLTHGHGDHAGGAARLHALSGAPVVAGRGDDEMLRAGRNRTLRPTGTLGKLLRGTSDKPFPPVAADLLVDAPLDLRPYGIDGRVLPVPGHTPGSLAVLLSDGDALVGDLLRGGLVASRSPARHFFHDDCAAAERQIAVVLDAGAKRLFVGHGGPIDAARARAYLADARCE